MLNTRSKAASFNCLNLRPSGPSSSLLLDKDHNGPRLDEDEEAEQEEEEDECQRRASKSCMPAATILQSWLVSLLMRGGGKKSGMGDEKKSLLVWRIVLQRLVSEVHCRKKKVVRGIRQSSVKKQIDFSYDESSYAKNFDMGHENWLKNDPGFRTQELVNNSRKTNESSR